jgi:D-alanyl-D-alanine-carboxypeptidase/D-alanyl-D-alanine-endopeptidase
VIRATAFAAVMLFLGAPLGPAPAQTSSSSAGTSLQAALDPRVARVPGTAIVAGVIDHGVQRIYIAGSTGNGRPLDEHTLFEIGSVSKTLTATALAAMALSGQVRLNDPISSYLPAGIRAPSKDGEPITLLNLAEQRSGLPRLPRNLEEDVYGTDPYANYTVADMFAFLNGYSLPRDPGASYEYSNYGIGLLGQLLARREGATYPQVMRRTVLDPLGMTATTFAIAPASDPATLAVGHDLDGAVYPVWHFQSELPAGGILSNVDDMLKFLRCNMGEGPLARACLYAQQPRADGEPRHRIGLVWNVNASNGIISHGGDTFGFHAFLAISADRKTGVVVLGNGPIVADIATHVLVPDFPISACPGSAAPSKTDPASYAGVYCNAISGVTFTVATTAGANQLSIALLPQPSFVYQRTGPDTYNFARVNATIEFVRSGERIVGLRLFQNGQTLPAVRLGARGQPVVAQLPNASPAEITLDPQFLQQYVGSYTITGATFTVTLRGAQLYVQLTGQPAVPVYASAKDHFFYKVVDAQIRFGRNASGAVTSLTLHQNGQDVDAARSGP